MPDVVLRLGQSLALLTLEGLAAVAPGDRIVRAQRLLRQATGRDDIIVGRRPSGRPCLRPPLTELGVSIAHSGPASLIGFSPCRSVGVDLEQEPASHALDVRRLAADHFSSAESEAVAAQDEATAKALFLSLWVAKEAILKHSGRGIVDGVAEPELAGHVGAILSGPVQEDRPIEIDCGALHLAVTSLSAPSRPRIFAALCQSRSPE